MATYYIDPVSGSNANAGTNPAAPIQTPYKSGFLAGLSSGDIVRFKRATTLTCTGRIDGNVSGVTYRAYYNSDGSDDTTQARPVINGNGVRQIWGMATDRTVIKFYDLDFTNWGDGGAVDSFAIANATTGDSNSIVTAVEVHNCRFYSSNAGTADTTAVHIFGADCIVEGCEFWDISDDAIWVKGDRCKIYNNTVRDINASGRNSGDCIQLGGRSDHFYVYNNYLDGSNGSAKQCFIISGATAGTGGLFIDNVCIGGSNDQTCVSTDQPGSVIRGNRLINGKYHIRLEAAATATANVCESTYPQDGSIVANVAGCTVTHNTIKWTGAAVGGTNGTASGIYLNAAQVSTVRNNILVGCGRGIRLDEGVASESYNAFFNCTVNVKGISADPALGTGSVEVDPTLRSDYMPMSSAVRSAGTYRGGGDFYGKTLGNPPTIGAVQYQAARTLTTRTLRTRSVASRDLANKRVITV